MIGHVHPATLPALDHGVRISATAPDAEQISRNGHRISRSRDHSPRREVSAPSDDTGVRISCGVRISGETARPGNRDGGVRISGNSGVRVSGAHRQRGTTRRGVRISGNSGVRISGQRGVRISGRSGMSPARRSRREPALVELR
jgi:hypothetical protein